MRLIKMFGLAAVAAVAAMAFMGASSAMAESTLLCNNNTASLTPDATECNPTSSVHFVTVKHLGNTLNESLELGKALLLVSGLTVECHALVSGNVLALGNPQIIHATIVYSDCTPTCSITVLQNGLIRVLKTGTELAEVTAEGFEVEVVCGIIIDCTYTPKELVGHGHREHGLPHVTYTQAPVKGSGITCPTSKLDALFRSLSDFFIRS